MLNNTLDFLKSPWTSIQNFGMMQIGNLVRTLYLAVSLIPSDGNWPEDYGKTAIEQGYLNDYDFIVVGAGSAGSVVASRLSENNNWTILLLEAGENPPFVADIPALSFTLQNPKFDWQYQANTSMACLGKTNGCSWPRGKVLGGTSTINSMFYIRGNKFDYDLWAKEGNDGWDFESCLTYFKKSEGNLQEKLVNYENGKYHNASGPVKIDYSLELNDVQKIIVAAAKERGYEFYDDMNADKPIGYWNSQFSYANRQRQSTARSFLIPAGKRSNLHVIKNAFVKKIIINENNEAEGVEFDIQSKNNRHAMKVMAKKEVILSGGTINSPQTLMLSGIGPSEQLNKFNIPIKMDSQNVGKNLFDHLYASLWFKFKAPSFIDDVQIIKNSGIFSHPFQIMGLISTVNETLRPDIEVLFQFTPPNAIEVRGSSYEKEIKSALIEANRFHFIGQLYVISLHPKSQGSIELKSNDPYEYPAIYPNYLSHPDDMETLVRAIKEQISYVDTNAYQSLDMEFIKIPINECDKYEYGSDEYWRCYIRYMSMTLYHPISTCKMGTKKTGVVDDQLKVHGIQRLRVIDASIMPGTVSGHTNAAAMMIGEKGADLIKNEYLKK